jgi:hypothetical protein
LFVNLFVLHSAGPLRGVKQGGSKKMDEKEREETRQAFVAWGLGEKKNRESMWERAISPPRFGDFQKDADARRASSQLNQNGMHKMTAEGNK